MPCLSKNREMMAGNFSVGDFGPQRLPLEDTESVGAQDLIFCKRKLAQMEKCKKEGYNRIKSKIK